MISNLKKIIIIYVLLGFNGELIASINNKIVLKVENEIITEFEIKNKILSTLLISNQTINQQNINQLKAQSLDSLILTRLKKIELSKYNFKNDSNELNLYLNKISSKKPLELKKIFEINNIDFELFSEEIEIQLKWQKLIYNLYSEKIKIDENEILNEVREIHSLQKEMYEYRLSEIEVLNDNENFNKIVTDLKQKIDTLGFENTALKFSISGSNIKQGDLGWIRSTSLSENIYKLVSSLKVGEVSKPIKQTNSILLLKLVDKKKASFEKSNFDDLKKSLINRKKNDLFNLYSRSHLSKLKNSSFIEYK
jgi:peptidyl-prolyl cis-trans isomerase SurA